MLTYYFDKYYCDFNNKYNLVSIKMMISTIDKFKYKLQLAVIIIDKYIVIIKPNRFL